MTAIDKSIPIPLYYQLKQILYERVVDGVYPKGGPVPSEYEMMNEFSLSRTTIRQAINELVAEGVLERHKGVGTFVPNTPKPFMAARIEVVLNAGHTDGVSSFISSKTAPADATAAGLLKLPVDTPLFLIDRLRTVDKKLLSFSRSHLPVAYFPVLQGKGEPEAASRGLYAYLDQTEHPITAVHQRMEIGVADRKVSQYLEVPQGSTVWIMKNLGLSQDLPVEYTITVGLPYQGICFEATSTRADYDAAIKPPASVKPWS